MKYPEQVLTVQSRLESFKLRAPIQYAAPMDSLTTFRVGGSAEALARPRSSDELEELLRVCAHMEIEPFVLGGGANIVVSDRGIPGIVIHTGSLLGSCVEADQLTVGAGEAISDASRTAAEAELAGLDFIYAMPGSTGGAVWMNARCYDGEIAPILAKVRYVHMDRDRAGEPGIYYPRPEDFAYKVSPFQDGRRIITEVSFLLRHQQGIRDQLFATMHAHETDRRAKGHFDAPCAGSIFKNNRDFGEPSGRIIDRCGLRGTQIGGARISDRHGNIIINTGSAGARDIFNLVTETRERVYRDTGFLLEPEVLFIGDWS